MEKRDDAKTLEVLFEISEAVTHTRNLDELYKVIHFSLGKILNVDNLYIALHHEEKDSITFPYHVDEKDKVPDEIFNFSQTASLTGKVIQSKEPLIFLEQDIIEFARKQNQETIGTVSKIWLGAPLKIKNRVIGVIAIQSFSSPAAYQLRDLDLLNTVSQHIALAIERKESEKQLLTQQQVLETILESSPVGICLLENRVFKWVNAEMVKMFGYDSKEAFTGQDAHMIYASKAAYQKAGAIIHKALTLGGKADFDFEFKRKNGSMFNAHIILTGSSPANSLESTIATIADISLREMAQQEKLKKEKLQGVLEMAGAICHEINQPLQAIIGYAALFDSPDTITVKELERIKYQATRIGDITKRLSKITRYKTIPYPGDTKIVDIWGSSK
ncbi:MAG: GAF domain-containing protein [Desulfobacteraceae bacterium]|nr:GAF domain-containing protein [Desulfobacteraceae bacterium]